MMIVVSLLSAAVKADVCPEVFATRGGSRPLIIVNTDLNVYQDAAGKELVPMLSDV